MNRLWKVLKAVGRMIYTDYRNEPAISKPLKRAKKISVAIDKTDSLCKGCTLSRLLCPPGHIKFYKDNIIECSEFIPNLYNAYRKEE